MTISENIRKLRSVYGITQRELASIAGVTENAVSKWENGYADPRMGAIEKIAACYGLSKSNIIEDGGMDLIDPVTGRPRRSVPRGAVRPSESHRATAPLLGRVHAGEPVDPDVISDVVELPDCVARAHPSAFFLQVEGDCMDRVYPEGCFILVDPDLEPSNGSIAAVSVDGHEAVMRRILRTSSTMVLSPDSYNPEHGDIILTGEDCSTVELIGTVVWFQARREMA